jgi:hypothetical protein
MEKRAPDGDFEIKIFQNFSRISEKYSIEFAGEKVRLKNCFNAANPLIGFSFWFPLDTILMLLKSKHFKPRWTTCKTIFRLKTEHIWSPDWNR